MRVSPVDGPQEFHPALDGDHLDGPGNGVFPVSLDAEPDPTEFDLVVVVAAQVVQLLHLGHLLDAGTKDDD